jgi:hypothetical protein
MASAIQPQFRGQWDAAWIGTLACENRQKQTEFAANYHALDGELA